MISTLMKTHDILGPLTNSMDIPRELKRNTDLQVPPHESQSKLIFLTKYLGASYTR